MVGFRECANQERTQEKEVTKTCPRHQKCKKNNASNPRSLNLILSRLISKKIKMAQYLKCVTCDKLFLSTGSLIRHLRSHWAAERCRCSPGCQARRKPTSAAEEPTTSRGIITLTNKRPHNQALFWTFFSNDLQLRVGENLSFWRNFLSFCKISWFFLEFLELY